MKQKYIKDSLGFEFIHSNKGFFSRGCWGTTLHSFGKNNSLDFVLRVKYIFSNMDKSFNNIEKRRVEYDEFYNIYSTCNFERIIL